MSDDFRARLNAAARHTEAALERYLAAAPETGEIARPERLLAAMRHAVLGPAKRLRPFFLIETARLFGNPGGGAIAAAAALECVHCYSLVHDDLPAMDDDSTRRGRPTVHRAFDEATAILAGDALLTLAFDILAAPPELSADTRLGLIRRLARAAGIGGMAGGQMLDIEAEKVADDAAAIRQMQAMKTGALFRFAAEAGAVLGGASDGERLALTGFGTRIGLAFQLADDLIDATGKAATAGKATAKDAAKGKATLVGRIGIDKARALLDMTVNEAVVLLEPFGERAATLRDGARFVGERES